MVDVSLSQMDEAGSLTGEELALISQLSTTVTITATTISAAAADDSLNDSGNGFVAAGFAVGDRVHVAGFTGNVANNMFSGVIATLAAGKMTIAGAEGAAIVDDAAGESVTITKWESKRKPLSEIGGGWTEAKWWDQAVDGSTQSIECDVTGAKEILVLGNDLTNASSIQRIVQASVDGGSNWFTSSGNYEEYGATGAVAANGAFFPHTTATGSARSISAHIYNNGFGRIPHAHLANRGVAARFKGSTTAINRVRVTGSSGGTGTPAGTMNGGTIQFLVR